MRRVLGAEQRIEGMEIGIVAQKGNDRATTLAADLFEEVEAAGSSVAVDPATAAVIGSEGTPVDAMTAYSLVVSVGGDGTFLYTARNVGATPILGVNLGEVGFLNAVAPGDAATRLREEIAEIEQTGSPRYREVPRLRAQGEGWTLPPGLNEVTVLGPRRGHGNGIELEVRVGGSLYTSGHADGVLIATPTGSTAYNMSEGGPLVHPDVSGLVITELCASEPMPSLVVDPSQSISVRATDAEYAVVTSDGERDQIETPAHVSISRAAEPGRIAGPRSDFFRALEKIERPPPVVDLP